MPQAPMRPHRRRGDYVDVSSTSAPDGPSPDWKLAVQAFLEDARSRNCSPATIGNYGTYLLSPRTDQFLRDFKIESVADVTPGKLRSFQAELIDAGLSPGTVATFHRIIRNFLGYCRRQGWGVGAETLDVASPRLPNVEPETYTAAEERRIVESARTGRDRFLVEFMLRTGLRLSEVAAVTLDDIVISADGAYLRVSQVKARDERIVPLDTGTFRFQPKISSYIRGDRPAATKARHLFLTSRRDPNTRDYRPLEPQGIKMLLRRLGQDTGLHVHAQKFRDTFAARALASGVDSLVVQRALGHSTLAMVDRFAHFQDRDVINAWRARAD
ncbi:MAG TPA: tyrosine-type recombinase/integrase [Candidatus Dormibacteraeota bacterium]